MDYGFPILRKGGVRRLGSSGIGDDQILISSICPHIPPSSAQLDMLHQTDRKIFIANNVDESEQELLVDYPPTYDLTRDIGDLICPRTKTEIN